MGIDPPVYDPSETTPDLSSTPPDPLVVEDFEVTTDTDGGDNDDD